MKPGTVNSSESRVWKVRNRYHKLMYQPRQSSPPSTATLPAGKMAIPLHTLSSPVRRLQQQWLLQAR